MGDYKVYVDGSYKNGIWGAGAVIIDSSNGSVIKELSASGLDLDNHRNITGEMQAVIIALRWLFRFANKGNEVKRVSVFHDYTGLKCWADGEWNASNPATQEYAQKIDIAREYFPVVEFIKVNAHSGDVYNDRADALAKAATTNIPADAKSPISEPSEDVTLSLSVRITRKALAECYNGSVEDFIQTIKSNMPIESIAGGVV